MSGREISFEVLRDADDTTDCVTSGKTALATHQHMDEEDDAKTRRNLNIVAFALGVIVASSVVLLRRWWRNI